MSIQQNKDEAVRTTIVGGRPPGSGRQTGSVPRGIEVLVKKAAVDPEFLELLLEQRAGAAAAIELDLDPAEVAMLSAIPREQLTQIVAQTQVPLEQRRVFLGRVAAAMLAVLGAGVAGCSHKPQAPTPIGGRPDEPVAPLPAPTGIRPDPVPPPTNRPSTNPPPTRGIQPDRPPDKTTNRPPGSSINSIRDVTLGIRPDRS